MKNKNVLELVYLLIAILAISALDYLLERYIGINFMPVVVLVIGIVITVKLFKKNDNQMSVLWKIIPTISILAYSLFTILLYLGLFNLINWENQPWLDTISIIAIILYIITFLPLSFYLLFQKYVKNSI
ncbi:MAG: hypothetical protein A2Y45_02075 [Tenericutes bacterium GWC2_34_14]|nr:MAG: hypothetical protein A2Y45_02075 [Tenericutes bacterium GWC2_34_14]OHE33057.1 MAG: hypothetical protein A2012_00005 [Tenericutes bacterium GWE2_34_108]OHE36177.1 MAG: hypothetical protein A2Y46_06995 [Tenericutes bacterium GWF1_35_14]OHE38780.1 MAG: hypothetical protein A2Y44_05235 [Tenericutes bacterium GWF2_35_184]OHE44719.1 MAG: hypothetical protein A2221_00660 [Tenericutes bacterium RIFOXYA2_FULL_36_32]OHE48440.1 MAG: hypothetical protein A2308_09075 [Tenericutes bacterium RIFOXYB2